ncbi:MAG: hypothetical protein ACE5OO_02995 [Candidatus Bathyarchaeia archaeon]
MELIGLWTGWLLMLMIYSYPLYKENPIFRFAEHTYIAAALAINLVIMVTTVNKIAVQPLIGGQVHYIIPILLGFMIYFLLVADYRWVSRYPISVLVGAGFGLGMRGVLRPNLLDQVVSTITSPGAGATAMDWFNFIYIAIGTICAVMYFLLTYEHTGALKVPTRLGRWFIMIGLGAYFGNTVLFRLTMLSGRAKFFLQVLKIIPM